MSLMFNSVRLYEPFVMRVSVFQDAIAKRKVCSIFLQKLEDIIMERWGKSELERFDAVENKN